jgi:hypothetical protein
MNVHDEMSDSEVLRAASEFLAAMPMAGPPDVGAILARGRAHRRRRLSAAAGLPAAAAAGTALALGLTGVLGPAPARGTSTIRTVSFTLVSNPNGTASLTINLNELVDAAALQNDLHQYGIPAVVNSGSFCSSEPAPTGFSRVVSVYPYLGPGNHTLPRGVRPTFSFNPAALPADTELSFGIFQLSSDQQQADFALINTNSYTCTSTPPPLPLLQGGQLQIGRPAGS